MKKWLLYPERDVFGDGSTEQLAIWQKQKNTQFALFGAIQSIIEWKCLI